jgi:hypothetical protein
MARRDAIILTWCYKHKREDQPDQGTATPHRSAAAGVRGGVRAREKLAPGFGWAGSEPGRSGPGCGGVLNATS